MQLGSAWIMIKRAAPDSKTPAELGYGTQSLTVFLDDVEAHFQRTKSAGTRILRNLMKPSMASSNTPPKGLRWPSLAVFTPRARFES